MESINPTKELPLTGMVRRSQFKGVIPLSDTTIWKLVKAGRFPQPLKVGPNLRLWNAAALHEWMRVGPDAWLAANPVTAEPA